MDGRRIMPDEVVAAYGKTGREPSSQVYVGTRGGLPCACGLAVVAEAEGKHLPEANGLMWLADTLGTGVNYARGFILGFDAALEHLELTMGEGPDSRTSLGVRDGWDCGIATLKMMGEAR